MAQTILVVEDEPSITDTIVYALRSEGFTVLSCSTARDAERLLSKEQVDFIVLDVGLPDQSGFELLKSIRQKSNIPALFLTARDSELDRIVGLEIGADDYLVKPFSPRELAVRVRTILRRVHAGRTQLDTDGTFGVGKKPVGPFLLNETELSIHYHETRLELSRYEYRLLVVLLKAPGRVFSREQLMNLAWEEPEMSLERTVDAHIKSLRAKLRKVSPADEPIITHRGFGYSMKKE